MTDPFTWIPVATAVLSGLIQHVGEKVLERGSEKFEGAEEKRRRGFGGRMRRRWRESMRSSMGSGTGS
ncbi:hypothetical protein [Synechococcus sp. PCC 7336]|uniref:hypothetical protein n=1 Tax=Synechococcus sp. PCC 7336 TaxID=195250 RepID=UPI0003623FD8|nr:hypothetical protein [Synechococcus sp. PCC 7336]